MTERKQIPRRFALTILLPFVVALFHAVLALAEVVHVYEHIEHLFPAIEEIPDWLWDAVIVSFSLFLCFALDRLFRLVRIRVLKFKQHTDEPIPEFEIDPKLTPKRRSAYNDLATVSLFFLVFSVIKYLSDLSLITNAFASLQQRYAALSHVPSHIWLALSASVIFYLCAAGSIAYFRLRARSIELPRDSDPELGDFAQLANSKLRFRVANSRQDVIDLAKTEDYGDIGETDVDQVYRWLLRYPRGNWLALYDNKIIGGIDIWPLKKDVYEKLLAGQIGEEDIDENSLDPARRAIEGTYWYVASISLAEVWRKSKDRREILARLVVDALEKNLKPAIRKYPAHVIALIWTKAGKNIAHRNGFELRGVRKSALHLDEEPIYEAVFHTPEEVDQLIGGIKCRLTFKR